MEPVCPFNLAVESLVCCETDMLSFDARLLLQSRSSIFTVTDEPTVVAFVERYTWELSAFAVPAQLNGGAEVGRGIGVGIGANVGNGVGN